jgi:hypothetical protein
MSWDRNPEACPARVWHPGAVRHATAAEVEANLRSLRLRIEQGCYADDVGAGRAPAAGGQT